MTEGADTTRGSGSNKKSQDPAKHTNTRNTSGDNAENVETQETEENIIPFIRRALSIVLYTSSALLIFCCLLSSASELDPVEDEMLYGLVYGQAALDKVRFTAAASNDEHAYCFDETMKEYTADGFCRYSTRGGDPLLILAPAKDEIFTLSPPIVLVHDALSDGDVDRVLKLTDHHFEPSETVEEDGNSATNTTARVAEITWVKQTEIPRISRRVKSLMGMTMLYAEDYQFGRYEPGGHYVPHCDGISVRSYIVSQGFRISTFLVYLNTKEPGEGGHTVFPNLKLSFRPQKGSALMWYSMFPNGAQTCDMRTLHGACPVAKGRKWIINVWNHMFGEEFTRPCPLDRHAEYTLESMDGNFNKFIYGDEQRYTRDPPDDMPNVNWPDLMENDDEYM